MTDPLFIWANQNTTLPVAGTPNKIKPDPQLIDLGWDKGQKPSAQEFNYVLNIIMEYLSSNNTTISGLKSAAFRDVGTGSDQIPDMSSFTVTGNEFAFLIRAPGGIVIQGGRTSTDINGYATVNLSLAMSAYSVVVGEGAVSQWVVDSGNIYSALVVYGSQILSPSSFGFRSIWWQGATKTFKGGAATAQWIAVGRV